MSSFALKAFNYRFSQASYISVALAQASKKSLFRLCCAAFFLLALLFSNQSAEAAAPNVCDQVARKVASETNVPFSVLWSITRVETGRTQRGILSPWPWTVNMEGTGKWFETEDAARAYVFRNFKRGARSFDVGCFQINYKWHGKAFKSLDEMFEPLANARYAADFLMRLYQELGDWSKAAGAYHSRTPKFADRYIAKFDRVRTTHSDHLYAATQTTRPRRSESIETRQNNYPLLVISEQTNRFGSLVPLADIPSKPLFRNSVLPEGS